MQVDITKLESIGIDRIVLNNLKVLNFDDLEKETRYTQKKEIVEKVEYTEFGVFSMSYTRNSRDTGDIYDFSTLELNPSKIINGHNVYNSNLAQLKESIEIVLKKLSNIGIEIDITEAKIKEIELDTTIVADFETFIKAVDDKPISELGFKVLFWTGARLGELLALTVKDILIDINKIDINKSLQMIRGREVVTEPKTPRSKRRLEVSDELMQELKKYIGMLYCPDENTRLFPFTKQMFERDIKFYAEKAGVKIIRVHDLRHSHASLLLHAGLDIITVSRRLGHENIETTLKTYSHMYNPNAQRVISFLNDLHEKKLPINSKEDII